MPIWICRVCIYAWIGCAITAYARLREAHKSEWGRWDQGDRIGTIVIAGLGGPIALLLSFLPGDDQDAKW